MKKHIKSILLGALLASSSHAADLVIDWTHDGAPGTEYRVYRQDDAAGPVTFPGVAGRWNLQVQTPGKTWRIKDAAAGLWVVRVTAWTATAGDSAPSDAAAAEVFPRPASPAGVKIRAVIQDGATAGTMAPAANRAAK